MCSCMRICRVLRSRSSRMPIPRLRCRRSPSLRFARPRPMACLPSLRVSVCVLTDRGCLCPMLMNHDSWYADMLVQLQTAVDQAHDDGLGLHMQAGAACVCNSAAWDAKVVTSAWWCAAEQVNRIHGSPCIASHFVYVINKSAFQKCGGQF